MSNSINRTKHLVRAAVFAALTAILSQVVLPIGPVPFNLAVLGAYLAGCLLDPLWAFCSQMVYLLLGLFGIPVFAGFSGGPAVLAGPTGGYIVGYLFIALLTALAFRRSGRLYLVLPCMIAGLGICYLLGTGWFMLTTGSSLAQSLSLCVVPFILPDLCKGAFALAVSRSLRGRLHAGHTAL